MLLSPMAAFSNGVEKLSFSPMEGDATLAVRQALEKVESRDVILEFAPGEYVFHAHYAKESYLAVTNHDNGMKRIIFPMDRFDSVKIIGNGADFIFRGRVLPFLFSGCLEVEMSDLSIDWDIPFYFQATVNKVNAEEEWLDVTPYTEGFSWSARNGQLFFPEIDGFNYERPGETLAFDPKHRRVAHGAIDIRMHTLTAERRPGGQLRLHTNPRHYPQEGTVVVMKGRMGENRYAPAIFAIQSNNIVMRNVIVHHALGMGFLFERCENVILSGCGVYVREGSDRMVSALADATHFCNCKGDILIENSRFKHMLDDATNVHGTYVVVDEVLNDRQVRVELKHFQQLGFQFADRGDEVWLIHVPDPNRASVRTVKDFQELNEQYSVITFDEPMEDMLRPGDLLENKTWNPTFTMRGSTVKDHRARGIVLKTPLPILIEDNEFSSMMSAIFFRGESFFWYESGAVKDVLIQNNRFAYSAYGLMEHAILRVTPRLGREFDDTIAYDRNIRFINNEIRTYGNRIVWVDRVAGLEILNNTIVQTHEAPVIHPDSPMIELTHCHDVRIEGNTYEGTNHRSIAYDETSGKTLTIGENKGFHPSSGN